MFAAYLLASFHVGSYVSPLGVALIAACRRPHLPAVVFGAVLGGLLPLSGAAGAEMAVASLLMAVLRLICPARAFVFKDRILWAVMGGCVTFMTMAISCVFRRLEPEALLIALGTGITAAAGSYFAPDLLRFLSGNRLQGLSRRERYSLIFFGIIALSALMSVRFGIINPGRLAAGACVTMCAAAFGGTGGACAGMASAAALLLGDITAVPQALFLSFASMGTGIFGKGSKWFSAASWALFYTLLCSRYFGLSSCLTETVGAWVLLAALPLPGAAGEKDPQQDLRRCMDGKLMAAGSALSEAADMVDKVSAHLRRRGERRPEQIFFEAQEEVCRNCPEKMNCFGDNSTRTDDAFSALAPRLRETGSVDPSDFPVDFSCPRKLHLAGAITRIAQRDKQKTAGVRQEPSVTGQLQAVTDLVEDLRDQLCLIRRPEPVADDLAIAALYDLGAEVSSACSYTDRYDRITVECRLAGRLPDEKLMTAALQDKLGRAFSPPTVCSCGGEKVVTFCESALLHVEGAGFRMPRRGNKYCGDDFSLFSGEEGFFTAVLSDGMGSGAGAAIDGGLTCTLVTKLLKAGFSLQSILELINVSLMEKGGEESFATLDLCRIDCFSGEAEFCKNGAAPTLICHEGRIRLLELSSLPLGILPAVDCKNEKVRLTPGDTVVLLSDGVWAAGEPLIRRIITRDRELPPSSVCRELVKAAAAAADDTGRWDDMTAVLLRVEKQKNV